jgi:hypothetical protein
VTRALWYSNWVPEYVGAEFLRRSRVIPLADIRRTNDHDKAEIARQLSGGQSIRAVSVAASRKLGGFFAKRPPLAIVSQLIWAGPRLLCILCPGILQLMMPGAGGSLYRFNSADVRLRNIAKFTGTLCKLGARQARSSDISVRRHLLSRAPGMIAVNFHPAPRNYGFAIRRALLAV